MTDQEFIKMTEKDFEVEMHCQMTIGECIGKAFNNAEKVLGKKAAYELGKIFGPQTPEQSVSQMQAMVQEGKMRGVGHAEIMFGLRVALIQSEARITQVYGPEAHKRIQDALATYIEENTG